MAVAEERLAAAAVQCRAAMGGARGGLGATAAALCQWALVPKGSGVATAPPPANQQVAQTAQRDPGAHLLAVAGLTLRSNAGTSSLRPTSPAAQARQQRWLRGITQGAPAGACFSALPQQC